MNEFKAGDRAAAKVRRNEINLEILAVEEKSYLVRNTAGKEFHAIRLTALPDAEPEIITEDDTPNPAPECITQKPEQKRSNKRSTGQSSERTRPKNSHASSKAT